MQHSAIIRMSALRQQKHAYAENDTFKYAHTHTPINHRLAADDRNRWGWGLFNSLAISFKLFVKFTSNL